MDVLGSHCEHCSYTAHYKSILCGSGYSWIFKKYDYCGLVLKRLNYLSYIDKIMILLQKHWQVNISNVIKSDFLNFLHSFNVHSAKCRVLNCLLDGFLTNLYPLVYKTLKTECFSTQQSIFTVLVIQSLPREELFWLLSAKNIFLPLLELYMDRITGHILIFIDSIIIYDSYEMNPY